MGRPIRCAQMRNEEESARRFPTTTRRLNSTRSRRRLWPKATTTAAAFFASSYRPRRSAGRARQARLFGVVVSWQHVLCGELDYWQQLDRSSVPSDIVECGVRFTTLELTH